MASERASEQFSVSWDNFHKNMSLGVNTLLKNEDFVDVTLAVEGRYLKAHKMVLSVCSPYFRELFKSSPCKHPIVFMKDVSYVAMNDLLQFMYQGEVQVDQEFFPLFIKTAESLQIRGLSNYANSLTKCDNKLMESYKTSKRPRFHSPIETVKNELEMAENVSTQAEDKPTLLKTEPYDQESTIAITEDNSNENFYEDSMEDINEWIAEEEDEKSQAGTSMDKRGQDPSGQEPSTNSLPPKSKRLYEKAYSDFMTWCDTKNINDYTENVMLAYFSELSQVYKASSIWSYYSKLKSTLSIYHNVEIGKFSKLIAFLKRKSVTYKPNRSKILSRDQVFRFLTEAPDDIYLMTKVAAIMGLAGALHCQELLQISVDDIEDEGNTLFINIKNSGRSFHVWNPKDIDLDFIQLYRKYLSLRPLNTSHKRFFIFYKNGKCSTQVVGKNSLGKIPATIAQYLNLPDSNLYTGHCLRRSSVTY